MPIQAVEPQRLYRQIAEQLRELIRSGEFAVGARLPAERLLSSQLGVSRPSLREALIALEVEGLVEVRPGSGIHVIAREPAVTSNATVSSAFGPFEVLQARSILESELAARAAESSTPSLIQALRAALIDMQNDCALGRMPIQGDREFHRLIAQAAGNGPLMQTVIALFDERNNPLFTKIGQHFENVGSWRKAIAEHQLVLLAIEAGDSHATKLAMQGHLSLSQERFEDTWPQSAVHIERNNEPNSETLTGTV